MKQPQQNRRDLPSDYEKAVLDKNPVAYWRLGEAKGPDVLDRSGNGHKGTCHGTVVFQETGATQGDEDTAVKLDGKKSFIEIGNHKNFSVPTSGNGLTMSSTPWIATPRCYVFWTTCYF